MRQMQTIRVDICGGARDGKSALIARLSSGAPTDRNQLVVAESANDEHYTRNLAAGAPIADVSVVVVDARNGVTAATRRHGFFAALLAVRNIVLAVNKMDLVGDAQAAFARIDDEFRASRRSWGCRRSPASRSRRRTATTCASARRRCRGTRGRR